MSEYLDYTGLSEYDSLIKQVIPNEPSDLSIADYIIEQNTSGIWTYRKWASGISECWGLSSKRITSWSSWGGLYEAQPKFEENYPANLFIDRPHVFVSSLNGPGIASIEYYGQGSASTTPEFYLLRPSTTTVNQTYYISIHAIGKWK